MSSSIASRLAAVRGEMHQQQLDAFVQPRADEYLGEYVPEHNERLLWLSGFSGSAGMVIVLRDSAAIFVDGRYVVQVRQQVDSALYQFHSLTDMPQYQWLAEHLPAGSRVGIDPRCHTLSWYREAQATLEKAGIELVALAQNPVDLHWQPRPAAGKLPVRLFSDQSAGKTSLQKRQEIAARIQQAGADVALISALDSCCWLLNLRGHDIPRLPVLLGTGLLYSDASMTLFTDLDKLPSGIADHVGPAVEFKAESALNDALAALAGKKLLADPNSSNAASQLQAQAAGAKLIAGNDPVAIPKARKNPVEMQGMVASHVRDGIAVSRFLAWLDGEVAAQRLYDEATLAEKLESFRKQQPLYQEPSFDTISAAGANAAMCHYNHLNGTPKMLQMDSLYLVDSGAQYLDGTTDVTRTIAIGNVTAEQKKLVTLVLKGHIALDQARFPKGTTGQQLDILARQYLWQHGFDYDHGTGHGVGHYLSVHEGPQRIGKNLNAVALEPGMVLSNEPGYYREGALGIRLENLVTVTPCVTLAGAEREIYGFEALTMIPMDQRLFDKSLMTKAEIDWVNRYHQRVYQTLAPAMSGAELAWLTRATAAM